MRTVVLEPILDANPIVIVDGDGTVLDCNLAWTKLVSTRHKTGLRTSLYDVVSFVGASGSPTSAQRELQVHHVAARDVEAVGVPGGPITTALLVPIVHRRRDTYLCVLLSPKLFHPDAVRFAELLAMDATAAAKAGARAEGTASPTSDEPELDASDYALTIELEGGLRSTARLIAALAGPDGCTARDLPAALIEQVRNGVPGRRVLVALRDTDRFGVPAGVALASAELDVMPVWRPGAGWPANPLHGVPTAADAGAGEGGAAREVGLSELPAWLQREFAGGLEEGLSPRFVLAEVSAGGARALVAVGPWRGTEIVAPDERLLIDVAASLLGHRLRGAERERALVLESERLSHALRAERAALGRTAERLEPVALSAAMSAAVERGRALEALGRPYAVSGPGGAGRRTLARYLIAIGTRRDAPVVEVGCRFHDERWLREEMFGGEAGPSTELRAGGRALRRSSGQADEGAGAPGKFELAAGGTLLVADIDQMPRGVQAALLESLRRPRAADAGAVPLLVATLEGEPERAAQAGALHPDLAALFGARVAAVPALAERVEDVPALAARFVDAAAAELGRKPPELTARAVDRLRALPWRGNVRELKAANEGAVALAPGGIVDADLLPTGEAAPGAAAAGAPPPPIDLSVSFAELKDRWVDHFERAYLDAALRRSAGNLSAAARLARMDKKNFHAKATRLGLAGAATGGRNGAGRSGALKAAARRRSMPPPAGDSGEGGDT
ncbi:MAG: sigma-54-dependent Fis family transcriptional regulator [Deltaproteobacteria bacterium]|nr:sigma-54-dependent Fis family transcriptional regulator [Deltaproteobacteria bacterium]